MYVSGIELLHGLDPTGVLFVQTGTHTFMTTKERIILACRQLYRYNAPVDHYIYLDLDRYFART